MQRRKAKNDFILFFIVGKGKYTATFGQSKKTRNLASNLVRLGCPLEGLVEMPHSNVIKETGVKSTGPGSHTNKGYV